MGGGWGGEGGASLVLTSVMGWNSVVGDLFHGWRGRTVADVSFGVKQCC